MVANGFSQRDVRRAGRRVLVALWVNGRMTDDRRPWLWGKDLAEVVQGHPPGVGADVLDLVIEHFLLPSVGLLVRRGKSRTKGDGIKLTAAGAKLARTYTEKTKAALAEGSTP